MPFSSLFNFTISPASTFGIIYRIWRQLPLRRRSQFVFLFVFSTLSGLSELISVGSVIPLLTAFANPNTIQDFPAAKFISTVFGVTSSDRIFVLYVLFFVSVIIISAIVRILNVWFNGRFAASVGTDFSSEAYNRALNQSYESFLRQNSSTTITASVTHIKLLILSINYFLQLITAALVSLFIISGLFLVNSVVALSISSILLLAYSILALFLRNQIRSNGKKIASASTSQVRILQEGLGAIRDVILDGTQHVYLSIYRQYDKPLRMLTAKNNFLSVFPRFGLEALGLISISLIPLLLLSSSSDFPSLLPILGTFALGSQRLLPALQLIYIAWTQIKSHQPSVSAVLELVELPEPPSFPYVKPLHLTESLSFSNVSYRYASDLPLVLTDISLNIQAGQRVAIVGLTGSGKSTTIDILMGLLKPSSGTFLVNGLNIYDPNHPERIQSWRSSVAHVPQAIYLSDSTIYENIAFGIPYSDIDFDRVHSCAQQAHISGFIESTHQGYNTSVGENGVRLSGGQRQRIGIARALYKNASTLILDEATSALDTITEESVMNSINSLSTNLTIIIVAHRLSTLRLCDRILTLDNGVITSDLPPV